MRDAYDCSHLDNAALRRLAAIEKRQVNPDNRYEDELSRRINKPTKPPGYSIHISGSGLSMVLKLDGKWIDSEPHCGNPNRARQYLARRAWKHYREMTRLREEALRA